MSVNKAILVGRLGKDPELRRTTQQLSVCSFSIATNDRRRTQQGEWADHTEWHNIVTFGTTADNCHRFLRKGREVFVEGRISTRKWQDKEGRDRYTTEIIASNIRFLGSRDDSAGGGYNRIPAAGNAGGESGMNESSPALQLPDFPTGDELAASSNDVSFEDDDIPF